MVRGSSDGIASQSGGGSVARYRQASDGCAAPGARGEPKRAGALPSCAITLRGACAVGGGKLVRTFQAHFGHESAAANDRHLVRTRRATVAFLAARARCAMALVTAAHRLGARRATRMGALARHAVGGAEASRRTGAARRTPPERSD